VEQDLGLFKKNISNIFSSKTMGPEKLKFT
jgi:hypothetical protein